MRAIAVRMNAREVRALLDGTKTQARLLPWVMDCGNRVQWKAAPWQNVEPGTRLWACEAFAMPDGGKAQVRRLGLSCIAYKADEGYRCGEMKQYAGRWRDESAMPRWASRLTLVVTAARIERLQMMSSSDAKAEGMLVTGYTPQWHDEDPRRYVLGFQQNWESLHGAGAWDENPEVVAITFSVHKANIDSMENRT